MLYAKTSPSEAKNNSSLLTMEQLALYDKNIALIEDDIQLTYGQLKEKINEAGNTLDQLISANGGGDRQLVHIPFVTTIKAIVAYLAVVQCGHVALITSCNETSYRKIVATYKPTIQWNNESGTFSSTARYANQLVLNPELAVLLSTSGSTGSPKLVRLSRKNLTSNAKAIAKALQQTKADRAITSLPLYYSYGLSVLHSHLAVGASIVVQQASMQDNDFWELAKAKNVTTIAVVPHLVHLLEMSGGLPISLPSLRQITQAGGKLEPSAITRWTQMGKNQGWVFVVMYGQTEASARICIMPPDKNLEHPDCVGVPIADTAINLRSPSTSGSSTGGSSGEIIVSGPGIMLGYAQERNDLALGRMIDELATGDLGEWVDGMIRITGRANNFVKIAGLRIDINQIEANLADLGYVACVVGNDTSITAIIAQAQSQQGVLATTQQQTDAVNPTELISSQANHSLENTNAANPEVLRTATANPVQSLENTNADNQGKLITQSRLNSANDEKTKAVNRAELITQLAKLSNLDPTFFEVLTVPTLPTLANQKLDREACKTLAKEHQEAKAKEDVPSTGRLSSAQKDKVRKERTISRLNQILNVPALDMNKSFSQQGGNSLNYVQASITLTRFVGSLPNGWQHQPLKAVFALHNSKKWWHGLFPQVESSVAIRAFAVITIIANHIALLRWTGGAHSLLVIAGYNLARFALIQPTMAQRWKTIGKSLLMIMIPTMIVTLYGTLVSGRYTWSNVIMLNWLLGPDEPSKYRVLWFIDSYVLDILVFAIIVSLPIIRGWYDKFPWRVSIGITLLALIPRFYVVWYIDGHIHGLPYVVFWFVALGVAIYHCKTTVEYTLTTIILGAGIYHYFLMPKRELYIFAAVCLLMYVPTIRLPSILLPLVRVLASASLYIYLVQFDVFKMVPKIKWVKLVASVVVGVVFWFAGEQILRLWGRLRSSRKVACDLEKAPFKSVRGECD